MSADDDDGKSLPPRRLSDEAPDAATVAAPLVRPSIPGSAARPMKMALAGGEPRTPRLGLAIPSIAGQKSVSSNPNILTEPGQKPGSSSSTLKASRSTQFAALPSLKLASTSSSTTNATSASRPELGKSRPSLKTQLSNTTSIIGEIDRDTGNRSRSESFRMVEGKCSNPTSASSSSLSTNRHTSGASNPASAISSALSDDGGTLRDDLQRRLLPDLEKLSLEKGRALDIDDLDDAGWRAASEQKRIVELGSLGEGAGGAVTRCKLVNGNTEFALKIITTDPNPDVKKQIVRELAFNKECSSSAICQYYGAFEDASTGTISIAMEYCAGGSLHGVYRQIEKLGGRVGEKVLGKVAEAVLRGLTYLHSRKIIHRDIKPSNILLTRSGQIRLCDFGVSGEFGTKGDANTFIGTSYYMAPERITGQSYTITSDVWSLGVTLLEVAQHRFPFPADGQEIQPKAGLIDLLTYIVRQPIPTLKDELPDQNGEGGITWSPSFKYFIECCLEKEPSRRGTPWRMMEHPWMVDMQTKKVNMSRFLAQVWDWED